MATGKRYYWIKLKETFMTSDAVDYLMGQPDGANYVVLYQMLCLKTINTDGRLERHIGEIIIPYDEAKIQRDTKWFSIDTIRVAMNLYKALGLIYEDNNGCLTLTDHQNLVGSETDYAEKNRRMRALHPAKSGHNVSSDVSENESTDIEIRDRDKRLEKENREVVSVTDVTDRSTADAVEQVVTAWNSYADLKPITKVVPGKQRDTLLRARIREYSLEKILEAIDIIPKCPFLMGDNKNGWTITFDWFIKPNNFPKVLEGNYLESAREKTSNPFRRISVEDW